MIIAAIASTSVNYRLLACSLLYWIAAVRWSGSCKVMEHIEQELYYTYTYTSCMLCARRHIIYQYGAGPLCSTSTASMATQITVYRISAVALTTYSRRSCRRHATFAVLTGDTFLRILPSRKLTTVHHAICHVVAHFVLTSSARNEQGRKPQKCIWMFTQETYSSLVYVGVPRQCGSAGPGD